MQRVYNHNHTIRDFLGLQVEVASVEEECVLTQDDGEEDIFCVHCLSGEVEEGNDIVLCDGAHSTVMGWHQKCLNPPL